MNKILHMLKTTFEVILVIGFIFFEELVWKHAIRPIYNGIKSLEITKNTEAKIMEQGVYTILTLFIVLFVITEVAGIYAGVLIATGAIFTGVGLYGFKVVIAAITFWIFGFAKVKLLTIRWFDWTYTKVMIAFDWVQSTDIYRRVKIGIYRAKKYVQNVKSNEFRDDIDHVYQGLVHIFQGRKKGAQNDNV